MKQTNTVSIFQRHPDAAPAEDTVFEPGFDYSRKLRPEFADRNWCYGLARYLDRRLRRYPKDLTVHLQRIFALQAAGASGDQLFAAAIDLNTILGVGGSALQQRVLESISVALSAQQRDYLVAISSGAIAIPVPTEVATTIPRNDARRFPIVAEIKAEHTE
ncbi:MAG: hypothetical protein WA632_11095 [Gallionella sp.]